MLISDISPDTCNSSLIDDAIISIDQIGFLPLSFIVLCLWFVLNKCYNSIVKILLSRLSIKDFEVRRLQTIYWNISFTTVTIPFALQALSIPFSEVPDKFFFNVDKYISIWFSQTAVGSKIKMIYILLTGFFLNKVCQISIEKGFKNVEFIVTELFTVFFVSTFAYRCIRFGIAFMVLYNIVQSFLEFTKMIYCFSKIYPSGLASFLTKLIFSIHLLFWGLVFLHIFPTYFLMTTLTSVVNSFDDASHVLILMLLNSALWGFYILHMFSSPLTKLLLSFVLQKQCSFEWILFGFSQPQIKLSNGSTSCTVEKPATTEEKQNKQKSKENLSKVYQTVKCYIRIKRKLKRIRSKLKEAKAQEDFILSESPKADDRMVCDDSPNNCLLARKNSGLSDEENDYHGSKIRTIQLTQV